MRLARPSLPRTLLTWVRAVQSAMPSSAAISLLAQPAAEEHQHVDLALGERIDRRRARSSPETLGQELGDRGIEPDLSAMGSADRLDHRVARPHP